MDLSTQLKTDIILKGGKSKVGGEGGGRSKKQYREQIICSAEKSTMWSNVVLYRRIEMIKERKHQI